MTTITTTVGSLEVGTPNDPSPLLITESGDVQAGDKNSYAVLSNLSGNVIQNDGIISGFTGSASVGAGTSAGIGLALELGTVQNNGVIDGQIGATQLGGILTNSGIISATASDGVNQSGGLLFNSGDITGNLIGVQMTGGTLTNETLGVISGSNGSGTGEYGVQQSAGAFTNAGWVSSDQVGLSQTGGTAINAAGGTIIGNTDGVDETGSSFTNAGSVTGTTGYGVGLMGDATLLDSGTLTGGTGSVDFAGGGNTLKVAAGAVFNGAVAGFGLTDTIDITNLTPAQVAADFGVTATSSPGGVLSFESSSTGETLATANDGTLNLTGDFEYQGFNRLYNQEYFVLTPDGSGGTDITLSTSPPTPPCYCRGTLIRTESGDVPVQDLTVGQRVRTAAGELRPVKWLGSRGLDCERYRQPADVWPVRIQAGAFAGGLPQRDLWLSPGHSVAVDGCLVQAFRLINGATIVQVPVKHVEYWHVELDSHDVIFADGMAAESYLDTGNRTAFVNGGAYLEAYPDFQPKHWTQTCVPFAGDVTVHELKATLLTRAASLGFALTNDADAHVMVDGRRIEPVERDARRLEFRLPAGSAAVELRCRTYIPAQTVPDSGDARPLGLCVSAVQVDGRAWALAEDTRFTQGWHALEQYPHVSQRWTHPRVPLPPGTEHVVLELCSDGRYWIEPQIAAARCA